MNEKQVKELAEILRGKNAGFERTILAEIYSELNQMNQKYDKLIDLLEDKNGRRTNIQDTRHR